jgi:hypothetical protein
MTNLFMSLLCFISKDLVSVLSLIIKFSRHDIVEILQKLELNTNQSIIFWSLTNTFLMFITNWY